MDKYFILFFIVLVKMAVTESSSRYQANDTLRGQPVPCTKNEKECLKMNTVYHAQTGNCYRVGSKGPCTTGMFLLDRHEFESGSGKLVGLCADSTSCPNNLHKMAYDGKCYSFHEISNTICNRSLGEKVNINVFGGFECSTDTDDIILEQPKGKNKCVFPNLQKDLSEVFLPRIPTEQFICSEKQRRCFAKGMLQYQEEDTCYTPLKQGPCKDERILVLDKEAAFSGTIKSACVINNQCAIGQVFMSYSQKCHAQIEITKKCFGMPIFMDIFGGNVCGKDASKYVLNLTETEGKCSIKYIEY